MDKDRRHALSEQPHSSNEHLASEFPERLAHVQSEEAVDACNADQE